MPRIAVITPTTGRTQLLDCVESVSKQSFSDYEHFVVIDGAERAAKVHELIPAPSKRLTIMEIPHATGKNNFCGHRIYGSLPFIIDAEWVCFLDEDNRIKRDHLASLVNLVDTFSLQWAYALRNIVDWDGRFICRDNCNSLGLWPSYDGAYHHVDTNCYFIRREVALEMTALWNRCSGAADVERADRILCRRLLGHYPYVYTTGHYSVDYRIGSRGSASRSRMFYVTGNQIMARMFKRFPWIAMRVSGRLAEHPCPAVEISDGGVVERRASRQVAAELSPILRAGRWNKRRRKYISVRYAE